MSVDGNLLSFERTISEDAGYDFAEDSHEIHFGHGPGSVDHSRWGSKIKGRIGEAPMVIPIKVGESDEVKSIWQGKKLYLIENVFSIEEASNASIDSVGLDLFFRLDENEEDCPPINRSLPLRIWDTFPSPLYDHGLFINFTSENNIGIKVDASDILTSVIGAHGFPSLENANGSITLETENLAEISYSFKYKSFVPVIQSIGRGDYRANWRFARGKFALVGRTISTWTLLSLPNERQKLEYFGRLRVISREAFFPFPLKSEWKKLKVLL